MSNEQFSTPVVVDQGMSIAALFNDDKVMDRMIRYAEIMATGKSTIPNELRNAGDCLAITMQAKVWGMLPTALAQKCHFIGGRIGYEAQAVAAAINNSGAVKDTFHFDWYGPWENIIGKFVERESKTKKDDAGYAKKYKVPAWNSSDEVGLGVRVWATLRNEDEPRILDLLLMQANTRNSTLWADDPRQQLAYLAQKRWARLYAPGVILGVYTPDELEQIPVEKDVTPRRQTGAQAAESAREQAQTGASEAITPEMRSNAILDLELIAKEQGAEEYRAAWSALTKAFRVSIGVAERDRIMKIAESIPGESTPAADTGTGEADHD